MIGMKLMVGNSQQNPNLLLSNYAVVTSATHKGFLECNLGYTLSFGEAALALPLHGLSFNPLS